MPLYFFWTVRHLRVLDGPLGPTNLESYLMERRREGLTPVEWKEYSDIIQGSKSKCSQEVMPLKIFPAQSIIRGREVINCVVSVQAPPKDGYYTSVISLFVEQLTEKHTNILKPLLIELDSEYQNNDPIAYEAIIQTLPSKKSKEQQRKEEKHKRYAQQKQLALSMETNPESVSRQSQSPKTDLNEFAKGDQAELGSAVKSANTESIRKRTSMSQSLESKNTRTEDCATLQIPFFYIKPTDEDPPYDVKLVKLEVEDSFKNCETNARFQVGEEKKEKDDTDIDSAYFKRIDIVSFLFRDEIRKAFRLSIRNSTFRTTSDGEQGSNMSQLEMETRASLDESFQNWNWNDFEVGGEDLFSDEQGDYTKSSYLYDTSGGNYGVSFEDQEKLSVVAKALAKEGCILAHQFKDAKPWLDRTSPLKPMEEIEIWMQTIPLQCWFQPPLISGYGSFSDKINRSVEFSNRTAYPVKLSVDHFVSAVGTITCRPYEVAVGSLESTTLRFTLDFRTHGNHEGKVRGRIKLPFATIPCWIPFRLQAQGPQLLIVTPFINFGVLIKGAEAVKTLVLRNNGSLRTKWRARIPQENLRDENLRQMSLESYIIAREKLIRAWPEWGTIEAYETVGIQIFLSAESLGSMSATCEITNEENPEDVCYVTILAHVQQAHVILRDSILSLQDAFCSVTNYSTKTKLQNLTSFPTQFKWRPAMGNQKELCSVVVSPEEGILPPKGTISCVIEFFSKISLIVTNLFIPCCVVGMNEPLIAKIEGTVFGACLRVVIPSTRFHRVRKEDLPMECRDELWPRICGIPDEIPGEEEKFYTNFLGMKYCAANIKTYEAPPPSTVDVEEEQEPFVKFSVAETKDDQVSRAEVDDIQHAAKKSKKSIRGKKKIKIFSEKLDAEKPAKDKKRKAKSRNASSAAVVKSKLKLKGKKELNDSDNTGLESKEVRETDEIVPGGDEDEEDKRDEEEDKKDEEEDKRDEEEDRESFVGLTPSQDKSEMPEEDGSNYNENNEYVLPEDDSRQVMVSEGRQIYFQTRESTEISTVTFTVQNEGPISTAYSFKVINNPMAPQNEDSDQQLFVALDEDFFHRISYLKLKALQGPEDLLKGKRGGVFMISPTNGILEAKETVRVTVAFQANVSGIFEDQLECDFQGMEEPYVIRLEALSTLCEQKKSTTDDYDLACLGDAKLL